VEEVSPASALLLVVLAYWRYLAYTSQS
jgi:hypothetical protein